MRKISMRKITVLLCLLALAGCAGQGWRFKWGASSGGGASAQSTEDEQLNLSDDAETRLRRLVAREVRAESRHGSAADAEVIRLRPYYVKQYVEFPEGPERFEIAMQDTDSRTAPLKADVRLAKVRYATKLQRNRKLVAADDNFVRSTGVEVITYEYRMSRWRRLGSTFVAKRTEERVDGQWVPVRGKTEDVAAPEARKGWFKRTFGFFGGR